MSFPNRPQISRVRSSHSLRSQPVKITRCPDVPGPSILSEVNLSGEHPVDPRPRRAVRRNAMKPRRLVRTQGRLKRNNTRPSQIRVLQAENWTLKNSGNSHFQIYFDCAEGSWTTRKRLWPSGHETRLAAPGSQKENLWLPATSSPVLKQIQLLLVPSLAVSFPYFTKLVTGSLARGGPTGFLFHLSSPPRQGRCYIMSRFQNTTRPPTAADDEQPCAASASIVVFDPSLPLEEQHYA
ncbi:unnamed protein product [Nesidiocoris tenuis]|uniref:Uncharacterized protein n=1 Tax=Nesidiocoris tenuis TaxID=355587 RepID=A0A6H5HRA8_9HEMI|nr:unnamed protein product [Nesidiocoris tenuis]